MLTLKVNLSDYEVYYIGKEVKELTEVLLSISKYYKLNFKGIIISPYVYPFSYRNFFRLKNLRFFLNTKNVYQSLFKQLPLLKGLEGSEIVIPFRNNVQRDIFLLAGIRPSKITLTADGVIDKIIPRNSNSWRWYGIKTVLNQIPVTGTIFTPSYLSDDTRKAGTISIIPDKILFNVFEEVSQIQLIKNLEKEIFQLGVPKSIIFSQHLALIDACSEEIELIFYKAIIDDLIKKSAFPIIFKPHPRETKKKIAQLKILFLKDKGKILFLTKKAKAIPIEVVASKLSNSSIQFITLSSSAPLSIPISNVKINTYTAQYLPVPLQREIANYSKKYNCKTILVS